MVADLKPPNISISAAPDADPITPEEQDRLRSGTRTPRPYHHDKEEIRHVQRSSFDGERPQQHAEEGEEDDGSAWTAGAGSESGTEADDERSSFVKALPAPHLRPRKGLKTGESSEYTLLTPSQLDDEGRRLPVDYFGDEVQGKQEFLDEGKEEQDRKLLQRRLAEFARRCSEVGLMVVIVASVLCGNGVWRKAYEWRRELLVHLLIIVSLILAYPVKLSIVDASSQARRLRERFRVPASFDPATVLYPPLLPVLVALLLAPASPALVLPNIVLGLSSLPQRLFPRSSRLGGFNVIHWFVSIVPLIASEYTSRPSKEWPLLPYQLKVGHPQCVSPETLVSLYPLHHALLQPLYYLTTTSLLISELHLLSAALINLLLLATSPQMIMLKSCLWIGGIALLISCVPVIRWNVTLMRVPKWKLRRPGHTAEERKSLIDAASDLINLQRAAAALKGSAIHDSDADEDEPTISIKDKIRANTKLSMSNIKTSIFKDGIPKSAVERRTSTNGAFPELIGNRPRRNTLPEREPPTPSEREASNRRKERSSNLPWYLHLTAAQAKRRKWLYACYVYLAILATVLIPIRYYVLERALYGYEPIGWAISYLIGQLDLVRTTITALHFQPWIPLPAPSTGLYTSSLTFPLNTPLLRSSFGPANIRLLLIAYWALVLLSGLLAVISLTSIVEVDTRRKVFHGVMVALLLPSTFVDPCACALALALILAVFLLLEIIRAGQVPPLGNAIGRFVAPYIDGRDLRGPVVVSHIFLLVGCAVPLWFSLASIERAGDLPWRGWELVGEKREVAMTAGVVCVGMGDAAASLIGRRYGRHKWPWVGGKSLEGSAAFAAAVTIGLMVAKVWLVVGGWNDSNGSLAAHLGDLGAARAVVAWMITLAKAVFCACGASFMEAVLTGANDNVVVPIALWLMVKGVRL
jgi:dolichol kinase